MSAPPDEPSDRARDAVLRAFTRDGRITAMPVKWSKKLILLDLVAQAFEPGRAYPERDVDDILRGYYDDWVTLRRYLVDAGMLDRENGYYWRIGGSFEV